MSPRLRVYWLPSYRYQRTFEVRYQEYWTRIHIWPLAILVYRAAPPSSEPAPK